MSNLKQLNVNSLTRVIKVALRSNVVPFIWGSPGCGKTAVIRQIADYFNLKLIDIRLATREPISLNGVPVANRDTGRTEILPTDLFPLAEYTTPDGRVLAEDGIPEGYDGWLIFWDEINQAKPAIAAAAYATLNEREVNGRELHERVVQVAAGNHLTDRAHAQRMGTALGSRLSHFGFMPSVDEWKDWADSEALNARVLSYIEWKGQEALYEFKADSQEETFPCHRQWENLALAIDVLEEDLADDLANVASTGLTEEGIHNRFYSELRALAIATVGTARGNEFTNFAKFYQDLPSFDEIKKDPLNAPVPKEQGKQFALTGHIAAHLTGKSVSDLDAVVPYIQRLHKEMEYVTFRKVFKNPRNFSLTSSSAFQKWNAQETIKRRQAA